jgi:hypothetical protein
MGWICDFEYYQDDDNQIWVKELTIVPLKPKNDPDESYTYLIKSNGLGNKSCKNWWYQFRRHGIRVQHGDYLFDEAIRSIQMIVADDQVFIKGKQKTDVLREYLNVVELPETLCNMKNLTGFTAECCKFKHSRTYCARRKAFYLRDQYLKSIE